MKFPQWVAGSNKRPHKGLELAANRLRFLLRNAALMVDSTGSLVALANHCEIYHQQLHTYIAKGAFPVGLASRIEEAVGRDTLRKEHLVFPLEIEVTE